MTTITHIETDQDFQNETTNYWFQVGDESYGVTDTNGERRLMDCDGCPFDLPNSDEQQLLIKLCEEVDNLNS